VVEMTMDVQSWLRKQLEEATPDLLRAMVQEFAEALMGADADALCGAPYGERSPERVNIRNGYRERAWDTRVGTIELAIPKLRAGSYFRDWLLARRRADRDEGPPGERSSYQAGYPSAYVLDPHS
jgi:putative transposase